MLKNLLLILAAIVLLAACQSSAAPEGTHHTTAPTPAATRVTPAATAARVNAAPAHSGDPERGRALFTTMQPDASITCSTCHRTDSEERLVGPGLLNVSERATNRVVGREAAQYLHDSITNPSAFVVDGYPDIMPKNWGVVFSEDELADLIAYLMTLH